MTSPHAPTQQDEETAGIGKMLLGVLIILTVMVVSTILLIPRLIIAPFRRQRVLPEGYGERPLETPPDAATVARRARLLALQLRHLGVAATELAAAQATDLPAEQRSAHEERSRALGADVAATLASEPDTAEATTEELAFLRKRPGKVTGTDAMDVSWRAESLAVLLWSLGRIEALPRFDEQVDPTALLALVDRPIDGAIARRAHAEVERMQSLAKLWHWRSRTRKLEQDGTPLPAGLPVKSYEEIVRLTTEAAQQDGTLDAVRDGDFKAMGKSFRWLTDDEWSSVQSIVMERHRALNWLCGYAPANRWDDVPTHT